MRYLWVSAVALVLVTGCSTKNYGRQGELTQYEKETMS